MDVIDGYSHCGLRKYEPIERVRETMTAAGVGRTVLVQHLGEFDNTYLAGIVASNPEQFAGVCLVNHEASDCVETLRPLAVSGLFKGVRLTTDMCAAAPHLVRAAAELGLIIVLFAPHGIDGFVRALAGILETHPNVRVALAHLGNPDVAQAPDFRAYREIFRLAAHPGLYYQVSGMSMFCPYPHEPLYDLIADAVAHFGPARVYWGSNYPVVGGRQAYIEELNLLLDGRLPVPADAVPALAGGSARRLWFAQVGQSAG